MKALWTWLTQFDVIKGVVLAIAVVVSSWYDLRAEVRDIQVQHQNIMKQVEHTEQDRREHELAQKERDLQQDQLNYEFRSEIRDMLKEIRAHQQLKGR